jgi:cyanophycinase-like exopeptidase
MLCSPQSNVLFGFAGVEIVNLEERESQNQQSSLRDKIQQAQIVFFKSLFLLC